VRRRGRRSDIGRVRVDNGEERTMTSEGAHQSRDGAAEGGRQGALPVVLVDGSNVAHSSEAEQPSLADIVAVCNKLRSEGLEPVVVVDAALRHQIDDKKGYEHLVDEGLILQAPAGTDADYFILSFARELGASVVSNDRYRDRIARYPEVEERIIRYMIVADEVVLERRGRRRD
jgi:hypothetical protein